MIKRKLLEKLVLELDDIVSGGEHLNIYEIQGLFFALMITPLPIEPDEWLTELFYGEMPEMSLKQSESLMPAAFEVYDAYILLQASGRLKPPFDFSKIKDHEFDHIYQWCNGFLAGLLLREAFWFGEGEDKGVDPYLETVANCAGLFKALVTRDYSELDNLDRLKADLIKEGGEINDDRVFAELFMLIPFALEILQNVAGDFTAAMDERITNPPTRVRKIGRNDPCLCGSGKKYKKCCLH